MVKLFCAKFVVRIAASVYKISCKKETDRQKDRQTDRRRSSAFYLSVLFIPTASVSTS